MKHKNFLNKFKENKLIVATHNSGKLSEIKNLLKNVDLDIYSSIEMNLPIPKEIGSSFEENAYIKSSETTLISGFASLSDDSGLIINALDGSPGIYSADWSGKNRNFSDAIKKIEYLMKNKTDYKASMVCVLCLSWNKKDFEVFRGEMPGKIKFPPRGNKGFGYDPIFIPDTQPFINQSLTYGEIDPSFKNNNSHRNIAFKKFLKSIFKNG
ncbi:MAG: non-canonical purine NTP pyrophosphatase, RdgB/HAM1 family [SAR116 cluster bacterium]|nr:non-canonical purine NTP pyrophosphatase, RdgB/HAM1 family [SAR116 cluster bacterium]